MDFPQAELQVGRQFVIIFKGSSCCILLETLKMQI
jgi:hypothetical protein